MDKKLIFRCFDCKKNYEKEINKELVERFSNTYEFCDKDLNKFVMLSSKGVYPYEYMDGWDKFNEKIIPSKESFYSNLTLENITEVDYIHANNVFKTFELNNLGDYHDLYVRSDTLLCGCLRKFQKSIYKKLWIRSGTLYIFIWFSMASLFEKDKCGTRVANRL